MRSFTRSVVQVCGLAAMVALASPAAAHHVMDGNLPSTFAEGLLSGIGHPVIGLDHLAFVIALGIGAALVPGSLAPIGAFVALSVAGVVVHLGALNVPMIEPLVALTVLLASAALIWSRSMTRPAWMGLAAVAGLLHGYAFGESIIGAERTVLGAYLLGIALITALIASGTMLVARRLLMTESATSPRVAAAGAALGCVGAVLLAVSLMPG